MFKEQRSYKLREIFFWTGGIGPPILFPADVTDRKMFFGGFSGSFNNGVWRFFSFTKEQFLREVFVMQIEHRYSSYSSILCVRTSTYHEKRTKACASINCFFFLCVNASCDAKGILYHWQKKITEGFIVFYPVFSNTWNTECRILD
jgi:hypothetical protein